jgi:DNA-binding MarR family transcriptional regulator
VVHATEGASSPGSGLVPVVFRLARRLRRAGGTPQLDIAALMLLHRLDCGGPTRTSDLAGELELDASTVSRQASALEQQGLITRSQDAADRRAWLLSVTPAGAELLTTSLTRREEAIRAATATWSAADLALLQLLLTRLADDLDLTSETP